MVMHQIDSFSDEITSCNTPDIAWPLIKLLKDHNGFTKYKFLLCLYLVQI